MKVALHIMNGLKSNILFLYLLFIPMVSCSEEKETDQGGVDSGMSTVTLSLKTNSMQTKSTDMEETIGVVNVLVFMKEGDGKYIYRYESVVTPIDENTYDCFLQVTDQEMKLVLLANVNEIVSGMNLTNKPYEMIVEELVVGFAEQPLSRLPMYGEKEITDVQQNLSIEVKLLRSVAAVEVSLDDNTGVKDKFQLKSIQAYRAKDKIQIIPHEETINASLNVLAPSVPAEAKHTITTEFVMSTDGISTPRLYLPESEGYGDEDAIRTEATCLIIGGIYKGDDSTNQNVSYYRVDFEKGNNIGDILRNNLYKILIEEVTGEGTTHPEESDGNKLTVKFQDWEDSEHKLEL